MMHWTEAEELAARVLGLDPDAADSSDIEEKLIDRFDINLDTFQQVADALIPFTVKATTALGGVVCQGYVHGNAFICKREA